MRITIAASMRWTSTRWRQTLENRVAPFPREISISTALLTPSILDRKSTRLNSSHLGISYAVFCLKKKTNFISPYSRLSLVGNPNKHLDSEPLHTRKNNIQVFVPAHKTTRADVRITNHNTQVQHVA